ncbi:hypothetical protein BJX64DRAFT_296845 [Aspergillus heterothallicus]
MSKTRSLLCGEITYLKARERESLVAHHLNLKSINACQVADVQEGIYGSFNICIPVTIFKDFRPGNADEKIRCEAGTYAWLEETCPDIPIPRLYGFAMATGETESRSKMPEYGQLNVGYLLIEYIKETKGKMLIGSYIINNNGFLSLENHPLSLGIQDLENERIPTNIPRDYTFSSVDSDYIYQISSLIIIRVIFLLFFCWDLRRGLFIYLLTDLHPSNILVDDHWHITSLVNLEWACSLPIKMVQPPHWLTKMAVNRIMSDEYNKLRLEFMSALTAQEEVYRSRANNKDPSAPSKLSPLSSPTGLFTIFDKGLRPRFTDKCPDHDAFHQIMPRNWEQDIVTASTRKLAHRRAYDIQLRHEFGADVCPT